MRPSTFLAVAAAVAPVFATTSTVVPVQQIPDGQIQNPATPLPSAPATYAPPNATTKASVPAPPPAVSSAPAPPAPPAPPIKPSAPPAPPAALPSGSGIPPSYGNITKTASTANTLTATVSKPSASPSASKPSAPSVQTGAANTIVGSTIGLGVAALLAALLG